MIILPVLIFLSVTFGLVGLYIWLMPTKTQMRLHALGDADKDASSWIETVANVMGPFAHLSAPSGAWETAPLRLKFIQAGIRHENARLLYFGAKTLLPLVFCLAAFIGLQFGARLESMTLVMYLLLAALAGSYLPNVVLHLKRKYRMREIFESFPDAADLMLVCVEAGLGLDASLVKVTEEIRIKSMALAEELHLTNLEMRAGGTRESALRHLALRTGVEEVNAFATMLTQADKFGTSIGDSLRVFSDDLRYKRQTRAEELAAKVPTKMLFPLVVCIFPSIIMVIMGPAAIRIVRTLLPMLSHSG
ncbi:MAG TPA: type II secretion system F family protein [Burkholderiaceae bacterium]|jgi:tight adherence protein C|nr:type II secretion system F family protein [Burkholderiaceae bacterium]